MPLSLNFGENFLDLLDYDTPENNNNNNNNKSHVSYQHAASGSTFHPNDSLSNSKLLPNTTYHHPNEILSNPTLQPSTNEDNDSSLFTNTLFHPNESLSKEIFFNVDTDEVSDSFGIKGLGVDKSNVTDQLNYDLR